MWLQKRVHALASMHVHVRLPSWAARVRWWWATMMAGQNPGAVVPSGSFGQDEVRAVPGMEGSYRCCQRGQRSRVSCAVGGDGSKSPGWSEMNPCGCCVESPNLSEKALPEVSSTLSFVIPKFPDKTGVESATWLLIIVSFYCIHPLKV